MKAPLSVGLLLGSIFAVLGLGSPVSAQIVARATYVNDGSFELPAPGTAAPTEPVAMAVGFDGAIHIADRRGPVFVFEASGAPARSYGSGELGEPLAIAVDDRGAPYVLDGNPKQVQVFRPSGELWYTIGGSRNGPARLNDPVDIAIGPSGFVYVLDKSEPSVRVFARDGLFVRGISLEQQIEDPVALTVDGDGTILVASGRDAGRIFHLPPFFDVPWQGTTPTGSLSIGASGDITSVVTDGMGTVIALDSDDRRLWGGQRIEPEPATLARSIYGGVGTGRGSFRKPVDVAFTPERHLLVLDRDLRKVERIALAESEPVRELSFGYPIHVSHLPPDFVTGAVLEVAGPAAGLNRLVMSSLEGRNLSLTEIPEERFKDFFDVGFRSLSPPGAAQSPMFQTSLGDALGTVALNDTLLVIAEPDEDRFLVFDLRDGRSLGAYGEEYQDDRELNKPRGIDLFPDAGIVIADHGNDRIAVFSPDIASLIASFPFPAVQGVAVSPTGELFAWDETGLRVAQIPFDGAPPRPLAPSLLPGPIHDIAFDAAGNLFLLERETSRVSVVDSSRERVLVRFGGRDTNLKASHISADDAGNVYVASLEQSATHAYRWDISLPELENVTVTLTSDGATVSWSPMTSPYLAGYRILATRSDDEPFEIVASTTESTAHVSVHGENPIRWVRVAPITIAGALVSETEPVPLLHLDVLEAAAGGQSNEVLARMGDLEKQMEEGLLGLSPELAQKLQWHAMVAEVALGMFAEAADREVDLEGWTGGDHGWSVSRVLAHIHHQLDNQADVLDHSVGALDVIPDSERGSQAEIDLLRMAVGAAFMTGAYHEVTELGQRYLANIEPDDEYELRMRLAGSWLELGQPAQALAIADDLLQRESDGEIAIFGDDRTALGWTAFKSAIALAEDEAVERWGSRIEPELDIAQLAQFHLLLGVFRLEHGRVDAARERLTSVSLLGDPNLLREPETINLSLGIYRILQDADSVNHSAGLDFLEKYADNVPVSLVDLRSLYSDSLAAFTVREETKARLGDGLLAWRDADFAAQVTFFEGVLQRGQLTREQEILARSLLASGHANVSRPEAATFELRAILTLEPDFDPMTLNEEAEALYAVRPFNGSLLALLDELRN